MICETLLARSPEVCDQALLPRVVAPCHAVPLLDQSFTTPSNLGGVINECCAFIAQTYTGGLSGTLAGVNIDVQSSSRFPLHVAVRRVTGGVPNSLLLGETTLSSSSAPLSLLITFPEEIEQVAGAQYAIAANYVGAPPPGPGQSQGVWIGAIGNFYSGGESFASLDGTSWFQLGPADRLRHGGRTRARPLETAEAEGARQARSFRGFFSAQIAVR